ncbi:MAG: A/G-specific adenine glycosylase [Pseudobdellovibrionaceae bacterium]
MDSSLLHKWYLAHKRDLPWRVNKDPYRIWISEVMLQQTTVAAVVPFYNRFIERFPSLQSLAKASEKEVLRYWSGLGYYSRARNLLNAAKQIAALKTGFPKTYEELIELPGFGPYTARAVASLAFEQKVGVLDGNVIRVISRKMGLSVEHWKPQGRDQLQTLADKMVGDLPSSEINQGLMELGATVCTPLSPTCLLCPWTKSCVARDQDQIAALPLKKPRKKHEVWVWEPHVVIKKNKIALIENDYAPFLKGQWLFPGLAKKQTARPKKFSFKHGITHHDIFVQLRYPKMVASKKAKWVSLDEVLELNPTSLVKKVLQTMEAQK